MKSEDITNLLSKLKPSGFIPVLITFKETNLKDSYQLKNFSFSFQKRS